MKAKQLAIDSCWRISSVFRIRDEMVGLRPRRMRMIGMLLVVMVVAGVIWISMVMLVV